MNEVVDNNIKKKKSFLKERIMRFKIVALIKRNLPLSSFLFLLMLSFLFGFWDVRKYELYDLGGGVVSEGISSSVSKYLKENVTGENFFLLNLSSLEKDLYLDIPKLKSVRIEKVAPNKLVLFLETFDEKYVAYLRDQKCYLLAQEGIVLDSICEDEEVGKECCKQYAIDNSLTYFFSEKVEPSIFEDDKDRLLIMEEVGKIVKVVEKFNYRIKRIVLDKEVVELYDEGDRIFRFTISADIDTQLKRFIVVAGKVNSEEMDFSSLDLRFERPVMRE
ncbi:MAG TPA: hypothetical protein P5311_00735 [Candidatus Dojkabacteria bacterium]|nr:hypothetical protein [Candidatus Dojkabacteria bacterium]